jgi:hypothetical protein
MQGRCQVGYTHSLSARRPMCCGKAGDVKLGYLPSRGVFEFKSQNPITRVSLGGDGAYWIATYFLILR